MRIRRKRFFVADEYFNNYFTSFRQLPHLGVNNIRATIKIGYANALSLGTNSCKKRKWPLLTAHIKQKKLSRFDSGQKDNRAVYIASKSFESKKSVRHWNKVVRKYI